MRVWLILDLLQLLLKIPKELGGLCRARAGAARGQAGLDEVVELRAV